ncbi:MAG: hypothetical protein Q8R02_02815 [Hyphomonadaceae bacterium]|nr:hypothetical protein [Hyphomonadaceae bacterium]
MARQLFRYVALAGAALTIIVIGAAAIAQRSDGPPVQRPGVEGFRPEAFTPFEEDLLARASARGAVHENESPPPADNNARGLILDQGDAAIVNLSVWRRKYGVSLDGTGEVLIKNFTFTDRRSMDIYGSGLIMGGKKGTRGETWLSNAWIDLKGAGPNPDYKRANNEAITVERGNKPLNIRRAVLIGGEESGIDNKGDVRLDASFVASGHRPIRIWNGGSLVIANSTVLAYPDFAGFWFGGGEGIARLDYYNCKFGRIGDRPEQLTSRLPDWMVAKDEDDPVDVRITRLIRDPFDRGRNSFWIRTETPTPSGYLR